MNDIESRLQRYREQALAEIGAYGGVEHGVEKTASLDTHSDEHDVLLEELSAVSEFLRGGGEIEKTSSYHSSGQQADVGYAPMQANRLREPSSLGAARTKEQTRPLQRTPGGSATQVHTTEGKDQPSKTASDMGLRDQILAQFGGDDFDDELLKEAGGKKSHDRRMARRGIEQGRLAPNAVERLGNAKVLRDAQRAIAANGGADTQVDAMKFDPDLDRQMGDLYSNYVGRKGRELAVLPTLYPRVVGESTKELPVLSSRAGNLPMLSGRAGNLPMLSGRSAADDVPYGKILAGIGAALGLGAGAAALLKGKKINGWRHPINAIRANGIRGAGPLAAYLGAGATATALPLALTLGGRKDEGIDKAAELNLKEERKPTRPISRFLTNPLAMGATGAGIGALSGALAGGLGKGGSGKAALALGALGLLSGGVNSSLAPLIARTIHARGLEGRVNRGGKGLTRRERGVFRSLDKEAAYDFPGGVDTYEGKEGPTLHYPGTELISTNERARDYTKRDAKRPVLPDLRREISEPAMSSSTDPVMQRALSNASEAGVKTAGRAVGGIRGLLLGGV